MAGVGHGLLVRGIVWSRGSVVPKLFNFFFFFLSVCDNLSEAHCQAAVSFRTVTSHKQKSVVEVYMLQALTSYFCNTTNKLIENDLYLALLTICFCSG